MRGSKTERERPVRVHPFRHHLSRGDEVGGEVRHPSITFAHVAAPDHRERKFFIDNLLVRIHFIIEMALVDRPCAMGV